MIIECACGAVIRGDSDQQLLAAARLHIEAEHHELGGPPRDEDLLAMAYPGESSDDRDQSDSSAPMLGRDGKDSGGQRLDAAGWAGPT